MGKPLTEFYIRKPSGKLFHRCKVCFIAKVKKYAEANEDKVKAYTKSYRENNQDKIVAYRENYYEENKEYVNRRNMDWYRSHRQHVREYLERNKLRVSERRRDYCAKHRDTLAEKQRKYIEANREIIAQKLKEYRSRPDILARDLKYRETRKEHIAAMGRAWIARNRLKSRTYALNRVARKARLEGFHTPRDIEDHYAEQLGRCVYCRKSLQYKFQVDHIIPITREGSTNFAYNLQLLCPSCNMSKNNKTHEEFLLYRAKIHIN